VGASEQPCLEPIHVLSSSLLRTLASSQVLARERVPLELVHVLLRRHLQTLGLPAVRGG
jgi:hypothetical protein